jgi:GMP synthase (glutamine-hydrolysing)
MKMEKFEPQKFIARQIREICSTVKEQKAVVALSGGLDSMVCFCLAHQALGTNAIPLFLDTGLLRANEQTDLEKVLNRFGVELQAWDKREMVFEALRGKTDPEDKRKAYRDVFYKILGQALRSYSADFLIQGTILSDIIETQKGIKIHHNVLQQAGINPQNFGLVIIEPIRELLKPQVKRLGVTLKLPPKLLRTYPLPGIGMAARIVGEVTPEKVEIVRKATQIIDQEIQSPNIFQAFPVLLNDRVTGIVDGAHTVGLAIALRIVASKDSLTARLYQLPMPKLEKITGKILKEIPGVVKVLLDITPKPPSTIEYV